VPLDHAVGLEAREPQRPRSGPQGGRRRQAGPVDRRLDPPGAGRLDDARRGYEPHELALAHAGAARRGFRDNALHELVRRGRVEIDDVRRDLDPPFFEPERERLDSGQPAAGLPHGRSNLARDLEWPLELQVEGEERCACAHEDRAECGVQPSWPVRRHELSRIDALLQRDRPAPAVERRPPTRCERAVEEHRHPELLPEPPCDDSCHRLRARQIFPHERDERDDVDRAHPRVHALVATEVDRASSLRDTCKKSVLQRLVVPDEREHGAVVVGVDVHVDDLGTPNPEGPPDRADDSRVAALGHVRDGLEEEHRPTLESVREPTAPGYYDRRAPEYDDWYEGVGLYAGRDRPGFDSELIAVTEVLAALAPARTLDVACGTGFLTQHLRGPVTGLDASGRMVAIAAGRVPTGRFVQGDALSLPFPDDSFDRVCSGHFYGHLDERQRVTFLGEARRIAPELVLVDASRTRSAVDDEWSERRLLDGSRWEVYKRWFEPNALLGELGGGDVLHAGDWFVVVRSPR
jgi:Methyltransferase domain